VNPTVLGTLAEVSIAGGLPRHILDNVLSADWSADGKTLAVSHQVGGPSGRTRLEMPPGHVLYETDGCIRSVSVAPSGKWLAFVEGPFPHSTAGSVLIVDMEGRVRARTPAWNAALGVAWSADGERHGSRYVTRSMPSSGLCVRMAGNVSYRDSPRACGCMTSPLTGA